MQDHLSFTSIYNPNSYTSTLCQQLLTFSEMGQFSDICIISSDNKKFHSHKCVLSAASDYFKALFNGSLKKSFDILDVIEKVVVGAYIFFFGLFGLSLKDSPSTEVKIDEVRGNVLKVILSFVYTGRIEFQRETLVEDILKGAIFFQIQPLITECNNLMIEKLDVNNCLGMLMFADQHDLFELYKKVSKFASLNFDQIINQEDFLKLDDKQLSEIISNEDLSMSSEENVYLSLIKWIDHDKPNRKQNTMELFSKIRYWLLSPTFIRKHRSKLPQQIEFLNMVCTWLEWHSLPDNWREIKPVVFSQPMKPGLLFVGGGKIQKYDEKLNIWTFGRFSNLPVLFGAVIAYKKKLVLAPKFHYLPIKCFDLQTREITNLPERNVDSRYFRLIVLNDELYIISSETRLVEKYNFSTGKWYNVTPMNTVFCDARAAVANGKLYVIGGRPPIMDIFNPDTNDWKSVHAKDDERWDFGFTEVGGKLYKFGGRKQIDPTVKIYTANVKRYDPINNIWEEMERLENALAFSGSGGASLNNKLIICGGIDYTKKYLNLVQEYDPDTNKWKTLPPLIEYKKDRNYDLVVLN